MPTLQDAIRKLSDTDARRLLATFARHQPAYRDQALTPEWREALHADPDLSPTTGGEGELARTALLLLADDPAHQPVLTALVNGPPPQPYGVLETAVIVSGVLFVLGSHIAVERDINGKWRFKFEKKPTDPKLLKALMEKLLGYLDNKM